MIKMTQADEIRGMIMGFACLAWIGWAFATILIWTFLSNDGVWVAIAIITTILLILSLIRAIYLYFCYEPPRSRPQTMMVQAQVQLIPSQY